MNKINRVYSPMYFNNSPIVSTLEEREKEIMIIPRKEQNRAVYDTFDNLFSTYLRKIPEGNVKKFVSKLFNDKLVFIGPSRFSTQDVVFTRILLNISKKVVNGVVLNMNMLDIEPSGETPVIDDCIYATYFGVLRSTVLLMDDEIRDNVDLHKLLTYYVYLIYLRAMGQQNVYNDKQKNIIRLVCVYTFYYSFFNKRHSGIIRLIKDEYSDIINRKYLLEFAPLINNIKTDKGIKDIPKILYELKVFHNNPSQVFIELLKIFNNTGIYSFIGSLDLFIPMIIMVTYPTNLYSNKSLTSQKIHSSVEDIIIDYARRLKFERTMIFYGE